MTPPLTYVGKSDSVPTVAQHLAHWRIRRQEQGQEVGAADGASGFIALCPVEVVKGEYRAVDTDQVAKGVHQESGCADRAQQGPDFCKNIVVVEVGAHDFLVGDLAGHGRKNSRRSRDVSLKARANSRSVPLSSRIWLPRSILPTILEVNPVSSASFLWLQLLPLAKSI